MMVEINFIIEIIRDERLVTWKLNELSTSGRICVRSKEKIQIEKINMINPAMFIHMISFMFFRSNFPEGW